MRKFGQTYDNVYTFYLSRPPADTRLPDYHCDWLVGMTEKATGNVRVGCGRYDWEFQPDPYRAKRLTITIETMVTLPPGDASAVFGWLLALDYPWTSAARVVAGAVYLNDGFYYHAWTELWLGGWVSADPIFAQIPADVTHIKLVEGGPERHFQLAGVLDRLRFRVVEEDT